jgi:hypothetical protein
MDDVVLDTPIPAPGESVGLGEVATAAGGLLAAGLALGLGAGSVEAVARVAPLLLAPAVGSVVLTTPALVVAHQILKVDSPVTGLGEALSRAVLRVGQVGWGFAPVTLLFAVTAPGSWPLVFVGDALLVGLIGTATAGYRVWSLDREHPSWALAVLGWCALTLIVAARILLYTLPTLG